MIAQASNRTFLAQLFGRHETHLVAAIAFAMHIVADALPPLYRDAREWESAYVANSVA